MNNAVATLATMFGSSITNVSNNMTVKPFKKDKKGDADLGIVSSSYKSGTIPTSFNSLKTVRDIMKRSPTSVFTYKADDKGLELKKILTDAFARGYDGGISIEPHMQVVFHDASIKADPQAMYDNYVEYGKRIMAMVAEIKKA